MTECLQTYANNLYSAAASFENEYTEFPYGFYPELKKLDLSPNKGRSGLERDSRADQFPSVNTNPGP